MTQLVPPYPLIVGALSRGQVIPFLGSGASLGTREANVAWVKGLPNHLPTASELSGYLAKLTEFPEDETQDLAKVAQYFDLVGGRQSLQDELHSIFNCDFPISRVHTFLARIPAPLLIVTTNYDDLIERAFDSAGVAYDLVIHTVNRAAGDHLLWRERGSSKLQKVNSNKLDIDLQSTTVIYKMHGAVNRRQPGQDHYVITEDDYVDFLTRMTKNKAIPAIFADPFRNRHFLFLGYGLYDWNLRVVLNRLERDYRGSTKSWAIQYNPKPLEQRFWQGRGVEVYNMTIEEFVQKLECCQAA